MENGDSTANGVAEEKSPEGDSEEVNELVFTPLWDLESIEEEVEAWICD